MLLLGGCLLVPLPLSNYPPALLIILIAMGLSGAGRSAALRCDGRLPCGARRVCCSSLGGIGRDRLGHKSDLAQPRSGLPCCAAAIYSAAADVFGATNYHLHDGSDAGSLHDCLVARLINPRSTQRAPQPVTLLLAAVPLPTCKTIA